MTTSREMRRMLKYPEHHRHCIPGIWAISWGRAPASALKLTGGAMRVPVMGLTCALAILAGSMNVGPARAQSLADRYAAEIDADHDGAISRAEYAAMTRSHFARYDLDKDGRLSGAERPPYMGREGSTTEAEYLETSLRVFDSQDGDHDGRIAGDEVARFWANLNSGQPAK